MSARPPRSRWTLSYLGLASAVIYLLAFTLLYWLPTYYLHLEDEIYAFAARQPWRGILFYLALGGLSGFYLAACRLVCRAQSKAISPWPVALWGGVFCLLLIPVQPITSSDVYGYAFLGRVVAVLGQNPFEHLAREFASDPFYFTVTFGHLPVTCGYGPLWAAISAGLGWLARDQLLLNLLLFKALAAALHLGGGLLVYATLRRLAPAYSVAGMLFYVWNPLLLYELVGNGHNDAAVAALALLGFFLLSRGRGTLAISCLAAAALVKPVVVLWLPPAALWLLAPVSPWSARLRQALILAVFAILPAVAAYAPFWAGPATFQGLLAQSDIYGNSLPSLAISILSIRSLSDISPGLSPVVQHVKLITGLIFAPIYLYQLWVVWRPAPDHERRSERLFRASFDVMLFYLVFVGFQFWPWYLTWLMVPAALVSDGCFGTRRRLAAAFCLLAPLLYFPFGAGWATDELPPWAVALLSALPIVAIGLWLAIRAWRAHRPAR